MLWKNVTKWETTIWRSVEQRNRKRDEENNKNKKKQTTLIRNLKKKSFLYCEQHNKHISNNMKNNEANKSIKWWKESEERIKVMNLRR